MSQGGRYQVLLADVDPSIRAAFSQQMHAKGWGVTLAPDGYQALRSVRESSFHAILLAMELPYRSAADVIRICATKGCSNRPACS